MRERQSPAEPRSSDPEIMSASDVRQNFGSVVNRVARGEGRILIEKHGTPAVGIVSIEDIRRLRQMDKVTSRRKRMLEEMRAPFEDVPAEELLREAENAVAEVRAERIAERQQQEMDAQDGATRVSERS